MPPGRVDLALYQGDDFSVWFKFTDLEHDPIDLTGFTFSGQVRRTTADADNGDPPLASMVCAVIDGPGGILEVSLTDTDTETLGLELGTKPGSWDLQADDGTRTLTFVAGKVAVTAEVTRP